MSLPPVTVDQDGATLTFTRFSDSVRFDFVVPVMDNVSFGSIPSDVYAPLDGTIGHIYSHVSGAAVRVTGDEVLLSNLAGLGGGLGGTPAETLTGSLIYPAAHMDVGDEPSEPLPPTTPNVGVAPPDFSTPVGRVRLILGDTDAKDVQGGTGTFMWYSDAEIEALLEIQAQKVRLVAAGILRGIAASQALKLKRWTSADLSVNGPAVSDALLKAAAALVDEQRAEDEADAGDFFVMAPVGGYDAFAIQARTFDGRTDWLTTAAATVQHLLVEANRA